MSDQATSHHLVFKVGCVCAIGGAFVGLALGKWLKPRRRSKLPSNIVGLAARRKSIVLFGDSLTQRSFERGGWGSELANHFVRKADVFNRGYGGYNTRWAKQMLPLLFPLEESKRHEIVTCFFGANDAAVATEGCHVPLDEYEQNLVEIVTHLKQVSNHVILISPPPVFEKGRLEAQKIKYGPLATGVAERTNHRAKMYAERCQQAGQKTSTPLLDLYTEFTNNNNWHSLFVDGLHFNQDGQAFVGRLICNLVDGPVVGVCVGEMEVDFPMGQDMKDGRGKAVLHALLLQAAAAAAK